MRQRKWLMIIVILVVIMYPLLVYATNANEEQEQENEKELMEKSGTINGKDEVIYANLSASGSLKDLYVVNIFDVNEEGGIRDYGHYDEVKNLTDLNELELNDDTVQFTASEGKFYYQGYLQEQPLPWDVTISYSLNGQPISPENLAGVDGELAISIETKANEDVDPLFYENYLLQIAVTLDSDIASEIEVSDATIANAGKNKQISFTVMPEQDADIQIQAQVKDFEMDGIEIAAIPPSMAIDVPDNELTEEMKTLSDAIEELNDGVGELKDGASELNSGARSLRDGSVQFKDGLGEASSSSNDLIEASETIQSSLNTINHALKESPMEFELGDFSELSIGLSQMGEGLKEAANGLTQLNENYSTALSTLDQAIKEIPAHQISEQDINKLYASGADNDVINQLLESYAASLTVKGTFDAMKEGFKAIEDNLSIISSSITEMGNVLAATSEELSTSLAEVDQGNGFEELIEGINEIATHYGEFHNGLLSYLDGVGQLSNSYGELHNGMSELTDGTSEFAEGVNDLEDGTQELYEATSDLPEQMETEIDQMIADYDKSDLDVRSFVSDKNNQVNTVQFVIQTESISLEEEESTVEEIEEEDGFWSRLKRLFIS